MVSCVRRTFVFFLIVILIMLSYSWKIRCVLRTRHLVRLRGELHGDEDDSDDSETENLLNHEVEHDLQELEKLNATFVATANAHQEEHGFSKREHSATSDVIDSRSFEDELGELLLQELHNMRCSPSNPEDVPSAPQTIPQEGCFETISVSKFYCAIHGIKVLEYSPGFLTI